jgi:hypothetical protein
MLAEAEAMVGGEDHAGVVHQVHDLEFAKQMAHPPVHHADLTAIGGIGLPHFLFGKPRYLLPVSIGRVDYCRPSAIMGHIGV